MPASSYAFLKDPSLKFHYDYASQGLVSKDLATDKPDVMETAQILHDEVYMSKRYLTGLYMVAFGAAQLDLDPAALQQNFPLSKRDIEELADFQSRYFSPFGIVTDAESKDNKIVAYAIAAQRLETVKKLFGTARPGDKLAAPYRQYKTGHPIRDVLEDEGLIHFGKFNMVTPRSTGEDALEKRFEAARDFVNAKVKFMAGSGPDPAAAPAVNFSINAAPAPAAPAAAPAPAPVTASSAPAAAAPQPAPDDWAHKVHFVKNGRKYDYNGFEIK